MLNNKTVAVVIPAYNEEKQISMVINTIPDFVDKIVIINDCSTDNTERIVKKIIDNDTTAIGAITKDNTEIKPDDKYNKIHYYIQEKNKQEIKNFVEADIYYKRKDSRLVLISLKKNSGVGKAVARGYKWCKDNNIDCVAKIDGDGQMDPTELESICKPIVEEGIDYVKGNRLIHRSAWLVIPKIRYFGNSILSILTKIASGYWHVSDTQTAYSAISKKALNAIRLHKLYHSYGYPNDLLVKLNIAFCTIKEVEIKPVYNIGEQSKMKILKVIPKISWLLFKSFFKRLWVKYLFRDFHPLFFLYNFAFILGVICIPYTIKVISSLINNTEIGIQPLLAFLFLFISSFQSLLFAMWMDIQDNERLYKN